MSLAFDLNENVARRALRTKEDRQASHALPSDNCHFGLSALSPAHGYDRGNTALREVDGFNLPICPLQGLPEFEWHTPKQRLQNGEVVVGDRAKQAISAPDRCLQFQKSSFRCVAGACARGKDAEPMCYRAASINLRHAAGVMIDCKRPSELSEGRLGAALEAL